MAANKKTLDPRVDKPANKAEVTKPFMIAYMQTIATPEDKEWFKKLVNNPEYQKEYTNNLDGTSYTDIDIPKVREAFIGKFYSYLQVKKKGPKTFISKINDL